jgi:hypothetical protein
MGTRKEEQKLEQKLGENECIRIDEIEIQSKKKGRKLMCNKKKRYQMTFPM